MTAIRPLTLEEMRRELERLATIGRGDTITAKLLKQNIARQEYLAEQRKRERGQ